jgi:hypothetical protein
MLRISLIIVIVLSLNSCCHFVGKGPVYNWSKDKSEYDHYLEHRNSPSSLSFELTTDKESYYIGEMKILKFKIMNFSSVDSVLIIQPNFDQLSLHDSLRLIRTCQRPARATINQVVMVDNCGRRIIDVNPPNLKLGPGDSLIFSDSTIINWFGSNCGQELNFEEQNYSSLFASKMSGIIPCCLNEGEYDLSFDYDHFMFDDDENPIDKKIKVSPCNFKILPFDEETKNEYYTFIEFCSTLLNKESSGEKTISKIDDFVKNNPDNIYNRYINRLKY